MPVDRPWWEITRAGSEEEARMLCKRLGTAQCAPICLSHMSIHTESGKCPEATRVWMRNRKDESNANR